MLKKRLKIMVVMILALFCAGTLSAQKLIEYEAGMGTRDAMDPDVWILYRHVKAVHEGMILYADSALLNTVRNDFTAFRNIHIILSDTTELFGDELYYDGNYRVVNIWGDTVLLVDGQTNLRSDNLTFDRNENTATYRTWGRADNQGDSLESRRGIYDATAKVMHIYDDVVLHNATSRLLTDTLHYNTQTEMAEFVSPTEIFHDTSYLYSEKGRYYTGEGYSVSEQASYVRSGAKTLICDTLHYKEDTEHGEAFGHVLIIDTVNRLFASGNYGVSDRSEGYSFVTDSALVRYVRQNDTLFLHGDTLWAATDSAQQLEHIRAYYGVRMFRHDVQGVCDSAFYLAADSSLTMFGSPVIWYGKNQCNADTIRLLLEGENIKEAYLDGSCLAVERVDDEKYNQVKGKRGVVYFRNGEPDYADILSNAEMVYYITEEGGHGEPLLVGVNVGTGSDMRIYFEGRQPQRVVTKGNPDMHTYPLEKLPGEKSRLKGFRWLDAIRPASREDVFRADNVAESEPLAGDLKVREVQK